MNTKHLTLLLLPLLALGSCTPPVLETEGDIRVHVSGSAGTYTYPQDALSREKLGTWLRTHEKQRCLYTLTEHAPSITINFPNRVTVFFYGNNSVHISPVSMRQYIRDATPADAVFCDYLRTLAPKPTHN